MLSLPLSFFLRNLLLWGLTGLYASCLYSQSNIQQSISVNSTGTAPHASAQLDVSATNKGILVPRLTTAQRTAIVSPATGLLVFDTNTNSFWYFNGTGWINNTPASSLADADGDTKIQVEESPDEDMIRFDLAGTEYMVLRKNASGKARISMPNNNDNVFIGENAGNGSTTALSNIAIGKDALLVNTTRSKLVAVGDSTLTHNGTGAFSAFHAISNVAVGAKALYANTRGSYNTAIGSEALSKNTSGNSNTASGEQALFSNTTGGANTATGSEALLNNTEGSFNTAVGNQALHGSTTGDFNTAIGATALFTNSTGNRNTAIGESALRNNTTGTENIATGNLTLGNNSTGNFNLAYGIQALRFNTTGNNNTAIGNRALHANMTRSNLVAVGDSALYFNGSTASLANQAIENTAVGSKALFSNTTGFRNTALGFHAIFGNTTGESNTGIGFNALKNTTGNSNVGVGAFSLFQNTSGLNNTAVGRSAYFTSAALNNTTCIGALSGGVSNVSNRIEIGNTSVSWIGGQVNWSTFSDARIKTSVRENVPGLDFITRLRPVTYHLDIHKQNDLCFRGKKEFEEWEGMYDIEQKQMSGFIAQEVEAAAQAAGYDFSGVEKAADETGLYSVRYAEFVVPLVKAMQEQQEIIEHEKQRMVNLEAENAALKEKLDKVTAALLEAGILIEK